ncbi:hypothetical protein ACFXOI_32355 [Streptomyces bacillaris]|uniref:hypothetical protein n=1 Tax=Streptomyces bacillaris TaxID=68179 RepID=UPI0036AA8ED1
MTEIAPRCSLRHPQGPSPWFSALRPDAAQDQGMDYPIRPALARAVPLLPTGPD